MVPEDAFVVSKIPAFLLVCSCEYICTGAPFSLDTAFEFAPLAQVIERRGEDDLRPLFVGVLGGGRTVADLGVAGGIEVGC